MSVLDEMIRQKRHFPAVTDKAMPGTLPSNVESQARLVGDWASVELDRMARLLERSLPFVIPQNTSLAEEIREVIEGHTFAPDGAE